MAQKFVQAPFCNLGSVLGSIGGPVATPGNALLASCRGVILPPCMLPCPLRTALADTKPTEVLVGAGDRQILAWVDQQIDELHAWKAGGLPFARKPYLGEVFPNGFRVRAMSMRRDEASMFLVAKLRREGSSTCVVSYRFETPLWFVRSLPWVAGFLSLSLGYVGFRLAPRTLALLTVASTDGDFCRGLLGALIGLAAGLCLGILSILAAARGIRNDKSRLASFLHELQAAWPASGKPAAANWEGGGKNEADGGRKDKPVDPRR